MDVKEVAKKASEELKNFPRTTAYSTLNKAILEGFFKGVADGNITIGQSWVGEILRGVGYEENDSFKQASFRDGQLQLISEIIASGMCCEGQRLGDERGKTFTERA